MVLKSQLHNVNKKIDVTKAIGSKTYCICSCCLPRAEMQAYFIEHKETLRKQIDNFFADISNIQKSSKSNGVIFAAFMDNRQNGNYYNLFPHTWYTKLLRCIQNLFVNCLCSCCFDTKYKRRVSLINTLKVELAPEPADVLWQNLEYTDFNKLLRKIGVYFISLILISISFTLIVVLNIVQDRYKDELDTNVNIGLSVIISIIIIVINTVLNIMLRKLSEYEKNDTQSGLHLTMGIKLTIVNSTLTVAYVY
jgi:hypothetical protein